MGLGFGLRLRWTVGHGANSILNSMCFVGALAKYLSGLTNFRWQCLNRVLSSEGVGVEWSTHEEAVN